MSENKETEKSEDFRSGYVAVIGRPNVGKKHADQRAGRGKGQYYQQETPDDS